MAGSVRASKSHIQATFCLLVSVFNSSYLNEHRLEQVPVAHGHAARAHEHVAARQGSGQRPRQLGGVVARDAAVHALVAVLPGKRRLVITDQHYLVGVSLCVWGCLFVCGGVFVCVWGAFVCVCGGVFVCLCGGCLSVCGCLKWII